MKQRTYTGLVIATTALLLACAGGGSDGAGGVSVGSSQKNPEDNFPAHPVSFKWQFAPAAAAAAAYMPLADVAEPFVVQAAWGNLRSIRLALPADVDCGEYGSWVTAVANARAGSCALDETEAVVQFDGPDEVALAAGTATTSFTDLALPIGTYRWIELRIDDADASTDHIPEDASMVVLGLYGSSTTASVRIEVGINREIRYETPGGFAIDATGGTSLVVNLDTDAWFAGISAALGECLDESESYVAPDPIFIADGNDQALECDEVKEALKNNLEDAGRFEHQDEDESEDDAHDESDDSDTSEQ